MLVDGLESLLRKSPCYLEGHKYREGAGYSSQELQGVVSIGVGIGHGSEAHRLRVGTFAVCSACQESQDV